MTTPTRGGATTLTESEPTIELEDGTEIGTEEPSPSEAAEPSVSPRRLSLFEHPDAHPVALGLLLEKKYGKEWEDLETETLEFVVRRDFRGGGLSPLCSDKINALRAMRGTRDFWRRFEVFTWCALPLNGVPVDFEVLQVPTYAQALVAADIGRTLRPDAEWSQEMRSYLRVVAEHDGVFCAIEPLDFLKFEPRGLLDPKDVQSRWPAVIRAGKPPSEETIIAEQLRRAFAARAYMLEARQELARQLPLVSRA